MICKSCNQDKDSSKFRSARRVCKNCEHNSKRSKEKEQRQANRLYVAKLKQSKGCVDCGITDPNVLDLDHIDPSNKLAAVSQLVRESVSKARIDKEIDKCVVRCANCHRIKTARDFGYYIDPTSLDKEDFDL